MVVCIVTGCKQNSSCDKGYFARIPSIRLHEGPVERERSERRHILWLRAISRADTSQLKLLFVGVCWRHFVSGQSADPWDEDNVDWVPTLNLGYRRAQYGKTEGGRGQKVCRRKRKSVFEALEEETCSSCGCKPNNFTRVAVRVSHQGKLKTFQLNVPKETAQRYTDWRKTAKCHSMLNSMDMPLHLDAMHNVSPTPEPPNVKESFHVLSNQVLSKISTDESPAASEPDYINVDSADSCINNSQGQPNLVKFNDHTYSLLSRRTCNNCLCETHHHVVYDTSAVEEEESNNLCGSFKGVGREKPPSVEEASHEQMPSDAETEPSSETEAVTSVYEFVNSFEKGYQPVLPDSKNVCRKRKQPRRHKSVAENISLLDCETCKFCRYSPVRKRRDTKQMEKALENKDSVKNDTPGVENQNIVTSLQDASSAHKDPLTATNTLKKVKKVKGGQKRRRRYVRKIASVKDSPPDIENENIVTSLQDSSSADKDQSSATNTLKRIKVKGVKKFHSHSVQNAASVKHNPPDVSYVERAVSVEDISNIENTSTMRSLLKTSYMIQYRNPVIATNTLTKVKHVMLVGVKKHLQSTEIKTVSMRPEVCDFSAVNRSGEPVMYSDCFVSLERLRLRSNKIHVRDICESSFCCTDRIIRDTLREIRTADTLDSTSGYMSNNCMQSFDSSLSTALYQSDTKEVDFKKEILNSLICKDSLILSTVDVTRCMDRTIAGALVKDEPTQVSDRLYNSYTNPLAFVDTMTDATVFVNPTSIESLIKKEPSQETLCNSYTYPLALSTTDVTGCMNRATIAALVKKEPSEETFYNSCTDPLAFSATDTTGCMNHTTIEALVKKEPSEETLYNSYTDPLALSPVDTTGCMNRATIAALVKKEPSEETLYNSYTDPLALSPVDTTGCMNRATIAALVKKEPMEETDSLYNSCTDSDFSSVANLENGNSSDFANQASSDLRIGNSADLCPPILCKEEDRDPPRLFREQGERSPPDLTREIGDRSPPHLSREGRVQNTPDLCTEQIDKLAYNIFLEMSLMLKLKTTKA